MKGAAIMGTLRIGHFAWVGIGVAHRQTLTLGCDGACSETCYSSSEACYFSILPANGGISNFALRGGGFNSRAYGQERIAIWFRLIILLGQTGIDVFSKFAGVARLLLSGQAIVIKGNAWGNI
jgi:hypothetical protein